MLDIRKHLLLSIAVELSVAHDSETCSMLLKLTKTGGSEREKYHRLYTPQNARMVTYEATPRRLTGFHVNWAANAQDSLAQHGFKVVQDLQDGKVWFHAAKGSPACGSDISAKSTGHWPVPDRD